jgi:hypothetical protein
VDSDTTLAGVDAAPIACVPNISPREGRKRLIGGLVQLTVALAVLAVLLLLGANRWWRLALFPVFWGAASGVFQWRDKT